jgi:hypothetical protein
VCETRLRDQRVETYHPGELTGLPLFLEASVVLHDSVRFTARNLMMIPRELRSSMYDQSIIAVQVRVLELNERKFKERGVCWEEWFDEQWLTPMRPRLILYGIGC